MAAFHGRNSVKAPIAHLPQKLYTPARNSICAFVGLILLETTLLMLPEASTQGPLSFLDVLFTATSACCVTGLIVCGGIGFLALAEMKGNFSFSRSTWSRISLHYKLALSSACLLILLGTLLLLNKYGEGLIMIG